MKLLITMTLILLHNQVFANKPAKKAKVTIDTQKIIHKIEPEFLSFGLDTAQIVGSFWWDKEGKMVGGRGKNKISPLNLRNKNLIKYTKALSPAYLRIGDPKQTLFFTM